MNVAQMAARIAAVKQRGKQLKAAVAEAERMERVDPDDPEVDSRFKALRREIHEHFGDAQDAICEWEFFLASRKA